MIRGFLFDYDGVMTRSNDAKYTPPEKLATTLNMPKDKVNDIFMSVWPDYLRGRITDETLWKTIERRTGQVIPSGFLRMLRLRLNVRYGKVVATKALISL
ncbi:MAG TPA: hypothetical protein VFH06_00345 [Candidatus Saccharimonadales bacterium]|nr:hypothetical protein [Candidatus Saccharimonadales bacterium]